MTKHGVWKSMLPLAAALLTTLVFLLVAIGPDRLFSSQPLRFNSDNLQYLNWLRNVKASGWYQSNPGLGYPWGQSWRYFPNPDAAFVAAVQVTAIGLPVGGAMNALIALVAVTNCVSAWFALIHLRVERWIASPIALAYATLPFFVWRAQIHLNFASYWMLPVAVVLGAHFAGIVAVGRRRTLVALGLLAGATNSYYIIFGVITIAVGCVVGEVWSRERRRTVGWELSIVVASILGLPAVQLIGYFSLRSRHFGRPPGDVEIFALRLSDMVLPFKGHPLTFLSHLRSVTDLSHPVEGALYAGALVLVGIGIAFRDVLLVGRRRSVAGVPSRFVVGVVVIVIVLAVPSGLSSVIGAAGFTAIRAWNRSLPLLAFLGLYRIGLSATEWSEKRPSIRRWPVVVGLLAVVAVDQLPAGISSSIGFRRRPDDRASAVRIVSSRVELAEEMADGAGTDDFTAFVYPLLAFQEVPPVYGSSGKDQMSIAVLSGLGRWTAGSLRGTPDDLSISLGGLDLADAMAAACASRFDYLLYDTRGVSPEVLLRDSAVLEGSPAVVDRISDSEGHFIAWRLGQCPADGWPDIRRIPRIVFQGDGTYGEFAQFADEEGVYRPVVGTLPLLVYGSPSTHEFDLAFDFVGNGGTISTPNDPVIEPVAAAAQIEVRLALCPSETGAALDVHFSGPGSADIDSASLRLRNVRVVPTVDRSIGCNLMTVVSSEPGPDAPAAGQPTLGG